MNNRFSRFMTATLLSFSLWTSAIAAIDVSETPGREELIRAIVCARCIVAARHVKGNRLVSPSPSLSLSPSAFILHPSAFILFPCPRAAACL